MNELIKRVCADILTLMNSSLAEPFIAAVLTRLAAFGYFPNENDAWAICFAVQKVENHIKNSCNVTSIPDGLFHIAVDKVCGEFLFTQKQTDKLNLEDLDLSGGAITSITEGDTTVSFAAGASDEEKFNALVNFLINQGEGELVCFRRIKW